tara:strand:- start:25759 stop:26121 length:363 start_codon:yes stop_codon:yes gene_type:complete
MGDVIQFVRAETKPTDYLKKDRSDVVERRCAEMKRHFEEMIETNMVYVGLTTRGSAKLPDHLLDEKKVILSFSHKFFIEDFGWDDLGIYASLTFGSAVFQVVVPWEDVLSIQAGGKLVTV